MKKVEMAELRAVEAGSVAGPNFGLVFRIPTYGDVFFGLFKDGDNYKFGLKFFIPGKVTGEEANEADITFDRAFPVGRGFIRWLFCEGN